MEGAQNIAEAVAPSTAAEELSTDVQAAHMATAVAAGHTAAAAVLVDIPVAFAAVAVDFRVDPGFSPDQGLVVFGRVEDSAVSVVVELKEQVVDHNDSHMGLAEVVGELVERIRSSVEVAVEAYHNLPVGGRTRPVVLVRRGLFLPEAPVQLPLLGRGLRIARIGRYDGHLVDRRPAAESCLSADALSISARQPVRLPRSGV